MPSDKMEPGPELSKPDEPAVIASEPTSAIEPEGIVDDALTPTSTRLPAFPPHAVVKPPTPEATPPATSEADAMDGEPLGEGLRWKARPKLGGSDGDAPPVVIRGKADVRKHGWGHLPPHILRRILSYVTSDMTALPLFRTRWSRVSSAMEMITCLTIRAWLLNTRRVSSRWRIAVDTHPFWWHLIRLLNPRYDAAEADAAAAPRITLTSSRSSSAVRSGPTPLRRLRNVSDTICVMCRMADVTDVMVHKPDELTILLIDKLGWVTCCEWHEEITCQSCFLSEIEGRDGVATTNLALYASTDGEVNAADEYRGLEATICRHCRMEALDAAITRQLRSCARGGGIIRGDKVPWAKFNDYIEYVMFGQDTARYTAETLVANWALMSQGRYNLLAHIARDLQTKDYEAKMRVYHQKFPPETPEQKAERFQLLRALDPYNLPEYRKDEDMRRRLYYSWDTEIKQRGRHAYEEAKREEASPGLNQTYLNLLSHAVVNDILGERFRTGVWVLPSVEADILSFHPRQAPRPADNSVPYSPLLDLIASTSHPFPNHPTIEKLPKPNPHQTGIFRLEAPTSLATEPILPPAISLQMMDERFMGFMRRQLAPPLRRLSEEILGAVGNEESAEAICAGMGLKEVLQGLRGEEVWLKPGVQEQRAVMLATAAAEAAEKAAEGAPGEKPGSPRVELVEEAVEEDMTNGIQIIHDEPLVVPAKRATSTSSTSLGKRKSPPAEIPPQARPADRGSRESSVPVPTTTTSSTPDDVVMPITPDDSVENLQRIPDTPPSAGGPQLLRSEKEQTLESIAKMAVQMKENGLQVEDEEMADDGASSLTGSGESVEVGRGADGHYESYDDEGGFVDDELEMDRQMREENELLDGEEMDEDEEEEELLELAKKRPNRDGRKDASYTSSESSSGSSLHLDYPSTVDLIMGMMYLPYIPLPATDDPEDPVGRYIAKDVIMGVWWDVRAYLRVCRCGICERARKREEGGGAGLKIR